MIGVDEMSGVDEASGRKSMSGAEGMHGAEGMRFRRAIAGYAPKQVDETLGHLLRHIAQKDEQIAGYAKKFAELDHKIEEMERRHKAERQDAARKLEDVCGQVARIAAAAGGIASAMQRKEKQP